MGRRRRTVVYGVAALVIVLAAGCSDDRHDARSSGREASSTGKGAFPYLLLRAPGWSINGGATAEESPGELAFGGVWTTSYESRAEPNRSVGAAMMMAKPDLGVRALASQLGTVHDVEIKGTPAVAVEEYSPQYGDFIATHVLWPIDSYVAWFTAYETRRVNAVAIADGFVRVNEAEWRAAVDRGD